jgi:hypothetical protein
LKWRNVTKLIGTSSSTPRLRMRKALTSIGMQTNFGVLMLLIWTSTANTTLTRKNFLKFSSFRVTLPRSAIVQLSQIGLKTWVQNT